MKRLVILTVGKTHSGKTTFAENLEQELHNSLVIDQDNHAEFINTNYKKIVPKQGPNLIKYSITQTIVEYAVQESNLHLILCNSNLNRKPRLNLLEHFHNKGFISVLINFDIPVDVLQARIANSQRSKTIFRSASTFEEVLTRQYADKSNVSAAIEGEAEHFFEIKSTDDVSNVIQKIVNIAQNL